MKKIIFLTLILLLSAGCSLNGEKTVSNTKAKQSEVKAEKLIYKRPDSKFNTLPITQSATCIFDRVSSASFHDVDTEDGMAPIETREIEFDSVEQSKQIVMAFIDLDTDHPKMTANNGQGELIKLIDNDEQVTLFEKSPLKVAGNTIVYTIFKKEGVITWTKQYKLLITPFASLAMGYCE